MFYAKLKENCHDFAIDGDNQEIITNVFHWCLRDGNGKYDPTKGLWIYGNVGTGKSILMKGIFEFIKKYWRRDLYDTINPRWINVPTYCGNYAMEGFSVFNSIPMGLDEVGAEITPTNHMGNKLNVVSHVIGCLYDNPSSLPHIVTTNLTMNELKEMYGARTIDRIGHLFNPVKMCGGTRRTSNEIWELIESEQASQINK
jgi:DNA replication protein DnaC